MRLYYMILHSQQPVTRNQRVSQRVGWLQLSTVFALCYHHYHYRYCHYRRYYRHYYYYYYYYCFC